MVVVMVGFRAKVGKDTIADLLVQRDRFIKISIAKAIKQFAGEIYGLTWEQLYGSAKDSLDLRFPHGTSYLTPRQILQKFGQHQVDIDPDIWSKKAFQEILELSHKGVKRFVVSDLRLREEVNYAKDWAEIYNAKIITVRVNRKVASIETGSEHVTEVDLANYEDWDVIIDNDDTIEEYYKNFVCEIGKLIPWDA